MKYMKLEKGARSETRPTIQIRRLDLAEEVSIRRVGSDPERTQTGSRRT